MTLANSLALTLLAAVCSSSAPRLVPLALLLLAGRCEAAGTICNNSVPCSSGCPTSVYGTSLCDGTFTGTVVYLSGYNRGLSGTIPPQLGDISQLKELYLGGNSISGTIPSETGKLSQLERLSLHGWATTRCTATRCFATEYLYLGSNHLSGTIPARLGDISGLGELRLYNNRLSGTIPADTGKLSQLTWLYLYNNRLSGTVPAQLGDISGLSELDMSDNQLAYPRSSEERDEYNRAMRICRGAGSATCLGVPPDGCSAFADVKLSVTDPNKCVLCDDQTAGLVLVGVCILIGIVALAAFVCFIVRHPAALKRWVSTAAILINHAQTASILASMRLDWPRSLLAIASALKLNLLMLPSAGCFVGGEDGSSFEQYAIYASSAMLLLLLAPILTRHVALCRRRLDIADTAELVLSLIYSLLFTFGWSLVLDYLAYAPDDFQRMVDIASYGDGSALFTVPVLGALLLVLLIRSFGNVLAFKRGLSSGVWRRPNSCAACCGPRPIPPRRLERQVAYLVGRFARHAPRWAAPCQLRQLLVLLLAYTSDVVFVTTDNFDTAEETFDAVRYAIATVAIAVTLVFWRLHRRALPFAFVKRPVGEATALACTEGCCLTYEATRESTSLFWVARFLSFFPT